MWSVDVLRKSKIQFLSEHFEKPFQELEKHVSTLFFFHFSSRSGRASITWSFCDIYKKYKWNLYNKLPHHYIRINFIFFQLSLSSYVYQGSDHLKLNTKNKWKRIVSQQGNIFLFTLFMLTLLLQIIQGPDYFKVN